MSIHPMTPVDARKEIGKNYTSTVRPCVVIRLDAAYGLKHQTEFFKRFRWASETEAASFLGKNSWTAILDNNPGVRVLVHATGDNKRRLHFRHDEHPAQVVRHDADTGEGYYALGVLLD